MSARFASGAVNLPVNAESITLTNLGLAFVPTGADVSVLKPDADADLIDAYVIDDLGADGFTVQLSAPIPTEGYRLSWRAYANETVTPGQGTLALSYADFFDKVRRFVGYGETLTEDQTDEIDGYIQSGVRQFYYPAATGTRDEVHEWTFLHESAQVVLSEGVESVTVPNVVGNIIGPGLYFDEPNLKPIPIVSEAFLLRMRSTRPAEGRPSLACLRHKQTFGGSGQAKELVFWPTPNAALTLSFRMDCDPEPLSVTNPFPLGGPRYSELVLESCLAVAEQRANDEAGLHTERFNKLLESAIAADRRSGAEYFGAMSGPEGGHRYFEHPFMRQGMRIFFHGQQI